MTCCLTVKITLRNLEQTSKWRKSKQYSDNGNRNPDSWSLGWFSEKEIESQRDLALICSELAAVGLHMYVCSCEAITCGASTLTSLLYQNDQLCNTLHLFLFPIDFNQFRLTCIPHPQSHLHCVHTVTYILSECIFVPHRRPTSSVHSYCTILVII